MPDIPSRMSRRTLPEDGGDGRAGRGPRSRGWPHRPRARGRSGRPASWHTSSAWLAPAEAMAGTTCARAHLTPTYAVIGCYRLLGHEPPDKERLAEFVRTQHPARLRKLEQEHQVFEFQQIQSLLWLGADVTSFHALGPLAGRARRDTSRSTSRTATPSSGSHSRRSLAARSWACPGTTSHPSSSPTSTPAAAPTAASITPPQPTAATAT